MDAWSCGNFLRVALADAARRVLAPQAVGGLTPCAFHGYYAIAAGADLVLPVIAGADTFHHCGVDGSLGRVLEAGSRRPGVVVADLVAVHVVSFCSGWAWWWGVLRMVPFLSNENHVASTVHPKG